MKSATIKKINLLCLSILLTIQFTNAQGSGILDFTISSIVLPGGTDRDSLDITDGGSLIIGDSLYLADTLNVENGDSINFSLSYNLPGDGEVAIYYDFNNDGLLTPSELVYQSVTSGGMLSDGFLFPFDALNVTPKQFFVQLSEGANVVATLSFYMESNNPDLIVKTNSNPKTNDDGSGDYYCIPENHPIIFFVENPTVTGFTLDCVKFPDMAANCMTPAVLGLSASVPSCITACPPNIGAFHHNMTSGMQGTLHCKFLDINGDAVWVNVMIQIGCCPTFNEIYSFTGDLPTYTNVVDFIETRDSVIVNPNQAVVFKAGGHIRMKPGFHGKKGSQFHGFTERCEP